MLLLGKDGRKTQEILITRLATAGWVVCVIRVPDALQ